MEMVFLDKRATHSHLMFGRRLPFTVEAEKGRRGGKAQKDRLSGNAVDPRVGRFDPLAYQLVSLRERGGTDWTRTSDYRVTDRPCRAKRRVLSSGEASSMSGVRPQ